jgi:putative thioredoxin
MTSDNIIDVTEESFELEVLNFSFRSPVVVDFWAHWCVPCRVLEPLLYENALEAEGRFRLARVNVDENPKLAERLKVRNLPAVKTFVDGRIISEFTGVMSETNLKDYLSRISPSLGDLALEKGKSFLWDGLWIEAEETYKDFLQKNPNNPVAMLGLVKALLRQGKAREADIQLANFPASHEYTNAKQLRPLVKAYLWIQSPSPAKVSPLEAAYQNGLRLAMKGNILSALDGFLDILRKDRTYRNDEVKGVYLGLLELLGELHPEVRQYRSDLSNVLF